MRAEQMVLQKEYEERIPFVSIKMKK